MPKSMNYAILEAIQGEMRRDKLLTLPGQAAYTDVVLSAAAWCFRSAGPWLRSFEDSPLRCSRVGP